MGRLSDVRCSLARDALGPRQHAAPSDRVHSVGMSQVLLLDAGDVLRRSIHRVLTAFGHTVDEGATDVSTAEWSDGRSLDVVIVSDESLEDGVLGALKHWRESRPDAMRLLLAAPDATYVLDALREGLAHQVLSRPFQAEALEHAVEALARTAALVRSAVKAQGSSAEDERRFLEAVELGALYLVSQPIFHVGGTRLAAREFLLRSRYRELRGPAEILDAVERCDRVGDLGRLVNQLAANQIAQFTSDELAFVNTHPAQFAGADVLESFSALVPFADRVVLEITERAPLSDYHGAERAIRDLGQLGFRIAVDDIGSGYNSLSVLAELHPAFIKADMGIVRNCDMDARKQRLIALLGTFASATGAELVAEGIETAAELRAVTECGAHYAQGYYLGEPQ